MVSKRNRIIKITDFLETLEIDVKISENKARGNKGFFRTKDGKSAIHIAKGLTESDMLAVLVHEFAHYLHYTYDHSLKNLDFIFDNYSLDLEDELIKLTVEQIPQKYAQELFGIKADLQKEIKTYTNVILKSYPDFLISKPHKKIENIIKQTDLKYLLKYDKIKILNIFSQKIYNIKNIDKEFFNVDSVALSYIKLKSLQRKLKRINSKISRLNKYYNSKTEIFARSLQIYFTNYEKCMKIAPTITRIYNNLLNTDKIKLLNDFYNVFNN